MLQQQVIASAARLIKRRPLFYLNIIGLLSLGIAVSFGAFGLLHYILSDALPYRDSPRLVLLHDVYSRHSADLLGVSVPELTDYRKLTHSFEGLAAIETSKSQLMLPQPKRINSAEVSSNLFTILGNSPRLGRRFNLSDEDPSSTPVAIVSERLARELPSCGTLSSCYVTADGKSYSVVGILPSEFRLPDDLTTADQTDLLIPLQLRSAQSEPRDNPRLMVIGRLRPSVTLAQGQQEMDTVAEILHSQYPKVYTPELGYVIRLQEIRAAILGDASFALLMATIAATFLFVVALTNAGTFLLISAEKRTNTLLTSIALGAPIETLRLQLLAEVFLLSIAAFAPGILLGWLLFSFVARFSAGRFLPLLQGARLSPQSALLAVVLAVISAIVMFVISQASLARAKNLLPAINREGRTSTATGSSIRNQTVSLTVQVALSTALIALFLLVSLSQHRLRNVSLGFQPRDVLASEIELSPDSFKSNESVISFYSNLLSSVRSRQGLEQSCLATSPPLVQGNETWPFEAPQSTQIRPGTPKAFSVEIMSGGCLGTLKIPLEEGMDLPLEKASTAAPVALVSRSLAQQLWPSQTAVGKLLRARLLPQSPWIRVIGVVGDVHHGGPNTPTAPMVYLDYADIPALTNLSVRQMRMLSNTTRPESDFNRIMREAVSNINRSVPVQPIGSLSGLLAHVTAPWRFTGQLLSITSLVGPLIAISGLYSLLSALVVLRRKELAIRIAVGASIRNIFFLLARHTFVRIAAGGILGMIASLILFSKLKLYLPQTLLSEAVAAAASGLIALLCIGLVASATLVPTVTTEAGSAYREE